MGSTKRPPRVVRAPRGGGAPKATKPVTQRDVWDAALPPFDTGRLCGALGGMQCTVIAQTTTRVATARTRARGSARLFVVRSHLLWRVWLSLPRRAARSRDAAARARAPTPLIPTPFSHTCRGPPCAPRAPAAGWPPRGRRGCLLARRQAAAPRPAPRLRNRAPRRRPPRGGRRPSPATSRVRCRGAWWAGRRAPREQSGGCDAKTPDCQ